MAAHANTHAHTSHSATPEARQARRDTALACACAGMLGLTLLSFHAVGGTYAKYVAKGSGSDAARVAKFGQVSITGGGQIAISGSSAMGTVTQTSLDGANAIALFSNDDSSTQTGQPVHVTMTQTEVAAKILLTITAPGWDYGTNDDGRGIMYTGDYADSITGVWFELGDGWEYVGQDKGKGTFTFSYITPAGEALDAPVMRYDRIYSSLTVEERARLADMGSASLTFAAEAIQVD